MKFLGKQITEVNKGYFGIRRCTVCNEQLRDVDLVEIHSTNYFCFIPTSSNITKRILVCNHCKAYMEINQKLWEYYSTYYNKRFDKETTDAIVNTLSSLSNEMSKKGVTLSIDDESSIESIDLIFNTLCNKYKTTQNVEEIVSVFYK